MDNSTLKIKINNSITRGLSEALSMWHEVVCVFLIRTLAQKQIFKVLRINYSICILFIIRLYCNVML